jgi:glutamine synthetase
MLDSIRLFEKSKVLRAGLGDAFVDSYAKLKHDEWRRYAGSLSAWEIDNTIDC